MANEIYVALGYYFPREDTQAIEAKRGLGTQWVLNTCADLKTGCYIAKAEQPWWHGFGAPIYSLNELVYMLSLDHEQTLGEDIIESLGLGGPAAHLDLSPLEEGVKSFVAAVGAPDVVNGNYALADRVLADLGKRTVKHIGWHGGTSRRWVEKRA